MLVTLVAIVLAGREAWRYHQWKKYIPVVIATELVDPAFTHVPKRVEVRYGKHAERWLQEGIKQDAAPPEKVPVSAVIAAPFDYQFLDEDNIHDRLVDPEQLVPALIAALHEPPPPDEESNHGTRSNRIKHAEMLLHFGEEKICYDWAVNELVNGKYLDGKELTLLSATDPSDLELKDPWHFIRPYIANPNDNDWPMDAEAFAESHCRQDFVNWCEQNLNNQKLRRTKREACFLVLADERPSLDLLRAARPLFLETPDDGSYSVTNGGLEGLARLGEELPSEECHALIAEYAFHRDETENDYHYDLLWEEYASPSRRRSVVEQRFAEQEKGSLSDLRALGGEVTNESLFEKARGNGPMRKEALSLLMSRFKGKPDPRLLDLLEDCFHQSDQASARDDWFDRMRYVGGLDLAIQLREQWEREDPATYFKSGIVMHQNGLTLDDLLEKLRTVGLAKDLTPEHVRTEVLADIFFADHASFIRPGEELDVALRLAGVKSPVREFTTTKEMLQRFSELSRGELKFELISENEASGRFGWDGKAFEFSVDPEACFVAAVMAEMLNDILKRFGQKNRFLSFADDYESMPVYYGDPQFAKDLHDRFGVQWRPGVESYWGE